MSSATKAFDVLQILSRSPYEYSVTELADAMGYSASGIYKLLDSLTENNYVIKTRNKKYSLGPELYFIGKTYEEHVGFDSVVRKYLVEIRDEINENVSFLIRVNGLPSVVCREKSHQVIRSSIERDPKLTYFSTASGKLMTAFSDPQNIRNLLDSNPPHQLTPYTIADEQALLEEYAAIRKRGYSISDQEYAIDAYGVAAPVRDKRGKVWACIGIGAIRARTTEADEQKYLQLALDAAKKISAEYN